MKKKQLFFSAFLLMVACLGWSNQQKEIVNSYNDLMTNINSENWQNLSSGLSIESLQLLDTVAEVYTQAGVPFDNKGEKLLISLLSETNLLQFSETIISVDFRNEIAILLSGQGDQVQSYEFVNENNQWKLNLVPVLNVFLSEAFAGLPATDPQNSVAISPTYISAGTGDCEFSLKNSLEQLSIWHVYCSSSNSDSWGDDWLSSSILGTAAEMGIWLDAGIYDIRVIDSDGNNYTLWQVELTDQGILWELTIQDRDEP